jgi:hypothetical protein
MTLVVYHFQAAKTTNRGYADASYLWVEGLMTHSESHFQAAKMLKKAITRSHVHWN